MKEVIKLKPQAKRVLNHLQKRGSITSNEALSMYAVSRLASRIFELRDAGYAINTQMVERYNKYTEKVHIAKYTLAKE